MIEMAESYLGEFPVDLEKTPYAGFTPDKWVLEYISTYGGIDGAHHKQWLIDQIARILLGTPVTVVEARWTNTTPELRFTLDAPTRAYEEWVIQYRDGEEGPDTYDYEEGVAP